MRTIVAGVLGAIAMYLWATIAHVATPLATIGLKAVPNEPAVMAAMARNLGDKPGLYFIPFMVGTDQKAMAAQETKLKTAPAALVAYRPPGTGGMSGNQLITEFVLELVESLLTAAVLAAAAGFSARLGMAAAIGLIAGMATNLSYWNWYGFSLDYSLANAFTEFMKFVVAGAVISLVMGWRRRRDRRPM
ncbi:MAG TPA: hypothetical protein VG166_00520 [Caulobacteraceae bacterium]|jgi:hypothetical protein|nr:hypothetical protein [Caulobacteraceae bacterium]